MLAEVTLQSQDKCLLHTRRHSSQPTMAAPAPPQHLLYNGGGYSKIPSGISNTPKKATTLAKDCYSEEICGHLAA